MAEVVGKVDIVGFDIAGIVPVACQIQRGGYLAFVVEDADIGLVAVLFILCPGISGRAADIVVGFLFQHNIDYASIAFGRITGTRTLHDLYPLHIRSGIGSEHLQHLLWAEPLFPAVNLKDDTIGTKQANMVIVEHHARSVSE